MIHIIDYPDEWCVGSRSFVEPRDGRMCCWIQTGHSPRGGFGIRSDASFMKYYWPCPTSEVEFEDTPATDLVDAPNLVERR
jgi:hypothetical protein